LNCNKTYFLQFLTKKQNEIKIQIIASLSVITNINSTKFLGVIVDNTLSWRDYTVELTSKLNRACYVIRAIILLSLNILRTIYFSYVHSVVSYGIIFWSNSHHGNSFKIQKVIIRIVTNTGRRDSCRRLYKQLQILSLPPQYIFSLLVCVTKNRYLFLFNSEIRDINTGYNYNLRLPSTNLTLVQKESCILEVGFITIYHSKLKPSRMTLSVLNPL